MENESSFRVVTIALFVAILAAGLPHRVRAARSGEKISRRQEGMPIMVLLRLFGFSTWIGLLIYMVNPAWMRWSSLSLPSGSRWIGALFGAATASLIYWMFNSLGANVTDTVAIRKDHALVTDGPYRWVRHPMYSATFLAVVGFSLLTANWFIALTGLIALTLLVARTPVEERQLIEKFGDQYRQYMKRTGRFFPRFR